MSKWLFEWVTHIFLMVCLYEKSTKINACGWGGKLVSWGKMGGTLTISMETWNNRFQMSVFKTKQMEKNFEKDTGNFFTLCANYSGTDLRLPGITGFTPSHWPFLKHFLMKTFGRMNQWIKLWVTNWTRAVTWANRAKSPLRSKVKLTLKQTLPSITRLRLRPRCLLVPNKRWSWAKSHRYYWYCQYSAIVSPEHASALPYIWVSTPQFCS